MQPPTPKLNGLILVGGQSSRMGQDKALLNFHGQAQALYLAQLLTPFCEQVFLSCRPHQDFGPDFAPAFAALPRIEDTQSNIGPLAGVLAAMAARPENAWLVVACDMPGISAAILKILIARRDASRMATIFAHPDTMLEPLCAIYEPACEPIFRQALSQGRPGLQGILQTIPLQRIPVQEALPEEPNALTNINTPAEVQRFIASHDSAIFPVQ